MILAGDIGGTHTRLAFFDRGKKVGEGKTFLSRDYTGLEEIIRLFLGSEKKVEKACFGIAGPIRGEICQTTNLAWTVDAKKLRADLGISNVHLLNDLEANAYGLSVLKKEELYLLHPGVEQNGNKALIAAGTGLGEVGLFWDGKEHHPFACEGGHTDFAPRNEEEVELFRYVQKKFGHVSYERIVSGPGIYTIFSFLVEEKGAFVSHSLREKLQTREPSKVIWEWAKQDPVCAKAIDWFISIYGAEAGNLALKILALGGMYIGGTIAPALVDRMKEGFVSAFLDKGRLRPILESIPIWIVLNDQTALLGAANYAEKMR